MKKIEKTLTPFIVLLLGFILLSSSASGQCLIDSGVPNIPGIYPPIPPDAIGCEYYETDITFFLPQDTTVDFAGNILLLPFNFFRIDSVVGLPPGMTWSCNLDSIGCNYIVHPDSAVQDTLGCIKISGTPNTPGYYPITVYTTANVIIFGGAQNQVAPFFSSLQVGPCPFVGSCYSFTQSGLCNPSSIDITNNIPSNGNPGYSYQWDLTGPAGFSYSTTDEDPFSQILLEGGDYILDYEATIDTAGFFLNSAVIDSVNCTDLFDAGDIYWILIDPSGTEIVNTSANPLSNGGSTLPINTMISGIQLDTGIYEFQVWDADNLIPDAGCATNTTGGGASIFFSIPTVNTGLVSIVNGGLGVTFFIDNPINTISCTDTITINTTPDAPVILAANNTICQNDSLELSVASLDSVQWYRNGVPIANASDSIYFAKQSGNYTAEIINLDNYCNNYSEDFTLQVINVLAPSIAFDGDHTMMIASPNPDYTYEWFDKNGNSVGSGTVWMPSGSGSFYSVATDTSGCQSNPSATITAILSAIDQLAETVNEIKVFPNPAVDQINVSFTLLKPQQVELQLFDLFGKNIGIQTFRLSPGSITKELNISKIPSGIYLLNIQFEDGAIREKIVVRK